MSPFMALWARMPTSLSGTTEVGSLLQLCPYLLPSPPPPSLTLPTYLGLHPTESTCSLGSSLMACGAGGRVCVYVFSCIQLCDPMDCSPPGSSVHGILQARILEWVAISFSRESSRPSDRTHVSYIAGRFFIKGWLLLLKFPLPSLCILDISSLHYIVPSSGVIFI